MIDTYDIDSLSKQLHARGTRLMYEAEVASTMEIGAAAGLESTVVLTDHQTAGRGRYSRTWDDSPGDSVLVTFVKPILRSIYEQAGTVAVSQLCVLAAYEALQGVTNVAVKIRWPNDLTINDRKLGGVLLMEGARDDTTQSLLFGVGLNVHASAEGGAYHATHLDEHGSTIQRGDIVRAIDGRLDALLPDLARLTDPAVKRHYDDRWQAASALIGRLVRVRDESSVTEGTVIGSPFGENLQLRLSDRSIMEVSRYGHTAHLEIV